MIMGVRGGGEGIGGVADGGPPPSPHYETDQGEGKHTQPCTQQTQDTSYLLLLCRSTHLTAAIVPSEVTVAELAGRVVAPCRWSVSVAISSSDVIER